MSAALLQVDDIHTYLGDSYVIQGVSLAVPAGKVLAVLGRNGAGKTTTLRSIMRMVQPRRGRVTFDGRDISRLATVEVARSRIAFVQETRAIFPSLSVEENLAIAARPAPDGSGWTMQRVFALFPRLAERRHHGGNDLSGGEQQMLAIARALVANPTLLVMDEPTEGLAPAVVSEVGQLIRQLREDGISVLLVEQNAAFAVDVADVTHVMHQGTIVHSSAPAALWKNDEIKTQYLGVPGRS